MSGHRTDRLSEDIKREIFAIARDLKDPRVNGKFFSIVKLIISPDAASAKVYISSIEGIGEAKQIVKGLESATGFIKREISNRLHMKKAPEILFVPDDSIEQSSQLTKMMDDLIK